MGGDVRRRSVLFGALCLAVAVVLPVLLLPVFSALDVSELARIVVTAAFAGVIVGVLVVILLRR